MGTARASRYPADWDDRRRRVYQRDGYQCQRCGARGGPYGDLELHCHHIVPVSEGGSHALANLTTLCWRCHDAVHDHHIPRMSDINSRATSDPQPLQTLTEQLNPDDYTPDSQPYVRYWQSFIDVVATYATAEFYSDVQSLYDIAEDWYYYTKSYQQLPPSHAVRDLQTELQKVKTTYSDVDDAYSAFIDRASELPEKPDECTDAERFLTIEVLKIEQIVTHAEGIKTADDVEELHHHYEQLVAVQRELLEHLDASTQVEAFQRAREIGIKLDSAMRQRMEPATTPTDVTEDDATQPTTSQRQTNHGRDTSGVVDFFNDTGGYGFIKSDQVREDVFFHMEDIGGPDLTEGTKVAFDIQQAKKGPRATNVLRGPNQGDGSSKSSQETSTSSEPDLDGQLETTYINGDDGTNSSAQADQTTEKTDQPDSRAAVHVLILLLIALLMLLLI